MPNPVPALNGALIRRVPEDKGVWLGLDGYKCAYPDQESFNRIHGTKDYKDTWVWMGANIVDIPDGQAMDTEARLIQPTGSKALWLFNHGQKRRIADQAMIMKYHLFGTIEGMDQSLIDAIPDGAPLP